MVRKGVCGRESSSGFPVLINSEDMLRHANFHSLNCTENHSDLACSISQLLSLVFGTLWYALPNASDGGRRNSKTGRSPVNVFRITGND